MSRRMMMQGEKEKPEITFLQDNSFWYTNLRLSTSVGFIAIEYTIPEWVEHVYFKTEQASRLTYHGFLDKNGNVLYQINNSVVLDIDVPENAHRLRVTVRSLNYEIIFS